MIMYSYCFKHDDTRSDNFNDLGLCTYDFKYGIAENEGEILEEENPAEIAGSRVSWAEMKRRDVWDEEQMREAYFNEVEKRMERDKKLNAKKKTENDTRLINSRYQQLYTSYFGQDNTGWGEEISGETRIARMKWIIQEEVKRKKCEA